MGLLSKIQARLDTGGGPQWPYSELVEEYDPHTTAAGEHKFAIRKILLNLPEECSKWRW
jgi:hypothetical protein